jgi:hypothetical protein
VFFFFFFSFTFASFAGDDEAFNFETAFAAADAAADDEGEVPSTFEDAHPIDRKRRVKESTTFVRAVMCCARRGSRTVVVLGCREINEW